MEDLTGLNWTSSGSTDTKQKPPPMSQSSYSYPLRPTPPLSGRSTPSIAPRNNLSANGTSRSNASTSANDSFANLVAFNAANPSKNLSLLEQQKKREEERARQLQKTGQFQSGWQDEEVWEKLGSGTSTPNQITSPPTYTATEDYSGRKLSATINKPSAHIDTSQRRPTPIFTNGSDLLPGLDTVHRDVARVVEETKEGSKSRKVGASSGDVHHTATAGQNGTIVEDDDPFGLGSLAPSTRPTVSMVNETANGDDDILGLLGRPVSEFSKPRENAPTTPAGERVSDISPADRALAELIDMGFAPEKSRHALETTTSGIDVQAAVGWLLNQAHQDSRSTSRAREQQSRRQESRQNRRSPPRQSSAADRVQPAWMKNTGDGNIQQSRQSSRSPVNGEKDPSKIAAELGNNLFKTANSLWKTGTKKLNQAVSEFNSDSDSSQPKWMREPQINNQDEPARKPEFTQATINIHNPPSQNQWPVAGTDPGVTDEALMLESADARPPPRKPPRPKTETRSDSLGSQPAAPPSQAYPRANSHSRFLQQPKQNTRQDPKSRVSKQAVEEQTAEAYISPARRKRTTPKPDAPEPNLLFESSQTTSNTPLPTDARKLAPKQVREEPTRPLKSPRPEPLKRTIPPVSTTTMQSCHTSRQAGTSAFKRGDYAQATTHYTSALLPLPSTHPLNIPLLTNRALSHLKTGDPKACIADTTTALELISPSRGVAETVDLGDEGLKDMNTYWGKAMMRQAEALEQLEKWPDAGVVWKACVEAGVGGATSIAGRNRCEQATRGPTQAPTPRPVGVAKAPPRTRPKPSALTDLSSPANSGEAVTRLRLANKAADRLDDEKFALADTVSDRVSRWRSGKENNLRALLASLDTVLWEGSGWKKVGMGELILPGKVKVVYMKGIGRVHPDKVGFLASFCFGEGGGFLFLFLV